MRIYVTISDKERIINDVPNVFMYSGLTKHIYLFFKCSHKVWVYIVLLGIVAMMVPSCGGSKQSSSMRQIEKHAKKNPVGEDGLPVEKHGSDSKKVRQVLAEQEKQKAAEKKEADKAYKDAVTRHRSVQSQETRDLMDQHLKTSNKKYSNEKEFFLVRWFRPKDAVEKIEKKQAKEVQRRMAATRKKAAKNNKELGLSRVPQTKKMKKPLPSPNDMPQGGGGVYKEGSATKYASPSGVQHGGGGSYAEGRSGSRAKASDSQHGGGGTYQTGRSGKGKKASDYQQGGGGNMSGKSKKSKPKPKK